MDQIYRITIHGKTLESRNLRLLLARAVCEKRSMDRVFRVAVPRRRAEAGDKPFCSEAALAAHF